MFGYYWFLKKYIYPFKMDKVYARLTDNEEIEWLIENLSNKFKYLPFKELVYCGFGIIDYKTKYRLHFKNEESAIFYKLVWG